MRRAWFKEIIKIYVIKISFRSFLLFFLISQEAYSDLREISYRRIKR